MVWDEANIIIERRNQQIITEALLMQNVISASLSKDGQKALNKRIGNINVETVPIEHPVEGPGEGPEWRGVT